MIPQEMKKCFFRNELASAQVGEKRSSCFFLTRAFGVQRTNVIDTNSISAVMCGIQFVLLATNMYHS